MAAKLILAEIVLAIESLHNANITHEDIYCTNTVIDSDGHLMLTDFGLSKWRTGIKATKQDWRCLSYLCKEIFPEPISDDKQLGVVKLLKNMTDIQLLGK